MKLIKTRSGRYINAYHAIAFSIEESVIEWTMCLGMNNSRV